MAQNRVFVSPGVYTSEKDLTFVTRQVGVTTLGLVGETTKGPAFQPIFVSDYNEFISFFGGLNAKKVKDTGNAQYELPYIAKSYLSKANQLYVTRVLGFSGYDAGKAWGITLDSALDTSTIVEVTTDVPFTLDFTGSTSANTISLVSSDSVVQDIIDAGLINTSLVTLLDASVTDTLNITQTFLKGLGNAFNGSEFSIEVTAIGAVGDVVTGTTTGLTTTFTATGYADVEDKIVALLRSRGRYNGEEELAFELVNQIDLSINPTFDDAENDPLGSFVLSGTSNITGFTSKGDFNFEVSFDKTKRNYITRVLGKDAQDGKTPMFVEEIFENMFSDLVEAEKVKGIKLTLVDYETEFTDYKTEFSPAVTPYVLSEVRGNKIFKLFRFVTISDGNTANQEIKISITNIKPDDKEFDVLIRSFYDTDANPVILERFTRCSMNPNLANYIGRKVGTTDGYYQSRSNYFLVEVNEEDSIEDTFPAGFVGYPIRKYETTQTGTAVSPSITYKKNYANVTSTTAKRKIYQGLSDIVGIEEDIFTYKGIPDRLY